jgi:hypothetical protein
MEKKDKFKNNDKVQKRTRKRKSDYNFQNVKEALKGTLEDTITRHKDGKTNCW